MRPRNEYQNRMKGLLIVAGWATFALSIKICASILAEYANYFPPNFDAEFLIGRQSYFWGHYWLAFYAHIITSPIAIFLGAWLMWTGRRRQSKRWHRRLGKMQSVLIIAIVVPTGLVMSTRAINGPAAGLGFATLSIALMVSMLAAIDQARKRNFARHKIWATRCFLMLCSPLVLRLMTATSLVTQTPSPLTYQISAWSSWMLPLGVFESVRYFQRRNKSGPAGESNPDLLRAKRVSSH